MRWLTLNSLITCDHAGRVAPTVTQRWVTVNAVPVQIEPDPVGRRITACPNFGGVIKPCTVTLRVSVGYSGFIRIDGHRVVLSHLRGLTDGTPPMGVNYTVRDARQTLVGADR